MAAVLPAGAGGGAMTTQSAVGTVFAEWTLFSQAGRNPFRDGAFGKDWRQRIRFRKQFRSDSPKGDPMDRLDRMILTILQEDATVPVAEIGRRVGLSTTPCWRRIQKWRRRG